MMLHQNCKQIKFSWRRISQSEIRNSAAAEKNWNRKARAGKNSFPPTPFLFARPSDWISEFKIRIFVKKSSDFNQKVPPIFKIRILGDCCLAPPEAGLGFGKYFEGIFEIQKQFLPAQTEVRTNLFFFRQGRKAKR